MKRHAQKVTRPDTKVEIQGEELMSQPVSGALQLCPMSQQRSGYKNNATNAEREGHDALCMKSGPFGITSALSLSLPRAVLEAYP